MPGIIELEGLSKIYFHQDFVMRYYCRLVFLFTIFHRLTHWKQNLFILDKPVKVSKGDRMEGLIKIYRHPEWRRHLRVLLKFKVFSGYQLDIEVSEQ